MSFRVKKWTIFFILLMLGALLYFGLFQIQKKQEIYFTINYTQNHPSLFATSLKDNLPFPTVIAFKTFVKESQNIREILSGNTKKLLDRMNTFTSIISKTNGEKDVKQWVIKEEEYFLLKDILQNTSFNIGSINCSSPTENSPVCLSLLGKNFSLKEETPNPKEETLSSPKIFSLLRNPFQNQTIIEPEKFQIFFEFDFIKTLRTALKEENISFFTLKTPHFFLSQEDKTNNGWAIQWGKDIDNIYFIKNELLYFQNTKNLPAEFIHMPLSFEVENDLFNFKNFIEVYQKQATPPPVSQNKPVSSPVATS